MKTKLVYVVVGNATNIYIEQAWCSIWSAKHFNPNSKIAVVADTETIKNIETTKREGFRELIDEIIDAHVPENFSKMEQSRWIKTNLRKLVERDFLFLDTDTLVTGDLSEIDSFTCNIGMVLDWHVDFEHSFYKSIVKNNLSKIYNYHYNGSYLNYYNSGVTFVKDTSLSADFYNIWHQRWLESQSKGWPFDQLSLFRTCIERSDTVMEINGIYNCQITASIQYLVNAKILHFYTANSRLHPFKDKYIFERIREEKILSSEIQDMILKAKTLFSSPSAPDADEIEIKFTKLYSVLRRIYNDHRSLYNFFEKILNKLSSPRKE